MVVYSVIFILLYAIAAYFCGNDLAFLIFLDSRDPYDIEIAYAIVINLVGIMFPHIMYSYGKRKGFLNTPLIICLCVVDFLFMGLYYLIITFFVSSGSPGGYFECIINCFIHMDLSSLCYLLLHYFVFYRIYITIHYFRKLRRKA